MPAHKFLNTPDNPVKVKRPLTNMQVKAALSKAKALLKKRVPLRRPFSNSKNIDDLAKRNFVLNNLFILAKAEDNPIILPKFENWWESWQVFNPGVVMLEDKIHLLYRSIGEDGISRFGYAVSENGLQIDYRLSYPVYEHAPKKIGYINFNNLSGGSWGGCEDPRIVHMSDDGKLYITYTACDGGLRVALNSIDADDFAKGKWKWDKARLISPNGQIHKNWTVFPEKIHGKYAILHSIAPTIQIEYRDNLEFGEDECIKSCFYNKDDRKNFWDSYLRGVGPPPIKTKYGWLILYHAMDRKEMSKYKVGAMLTDLNDPTKILYRAPSPILEPNEEYENSGFKAGVVYASGAVVKDGKLFVYYGASDSYVCVAYTDLEEFLNKLINYEKPVLKKQIVKTKKKR